MNLTTESTEGNCNFCCNFYEADIFSNRIGVEDDHCTLPDEEDLITAILSTGFDYICPKFNRGRPQGAPTNHGHLFDSLSFLYGETEVVKSYITVTTATSQEELEEQEAPKRQLWITAAAG